MIYHNIMFCFARYFSPLHFVRQVEAMQQVWYGVVCEIELSFKKRKMRLITFNSLTRGLLLFQRAVGLDNVPLMNDIII